MPTYGLKYQTQFTSESDDNNAELDYTLKFKRKDYTGEVATLIGSETTVIQKCTTDDPFAPIKGQSLSISILNKGESLPITTFQSDADDDWMVELWQDTNLLFIGFLVQDDFYEQMIDYTHAIQLNANDNLGLLKGVVLSDASVRRSYNVTYLGVVLLPSIIYVYTEDDAFYPQIGNAFEVAGTIYTITSVLYGTQTISGNTINWAIGVTPITPVYALTTGTVYLTGEINLLNKNSLLSIIAVCLGQTNLELITNFFFNLYEYRQDNTVLSFDQTLINSQVFISGDTYQDCYSALEKILKTFNCSLFQANGQWNIINWHEAVPKISWSYANNAIPAFIYDETWGAIGTTVLDNNFNIGRAPQLSRPITGLTQGALRGYKFTKRKFDYNQPKYLLKNYDLQEVGALLRQYVSGLNTIYEYVATSWEEDLNTPVTERFIRVIRETGSGTELDRCLVVKGSGGVNDPTSVQGIPFEISEGDKVLVSFTYHTADSQAGAGTTVFGVRLYDGVSDVYVDDPPPTGTGGWGSLGYNYLYPVGSNTNQKQVVEIQSAQAPFSGLLYVYLAQADAIGPVTETWYRDIRVEYQPYIADQVKIIGQVHSQTRTDGPKLFSEQDIFIDDTPRNSINGTLFLTTKTSLISDRTTYWRYPATADGWRLGELATFDELNWRQKTRSKLEGGFIGNYQNGLPISLLTVGITDFSPTKNYIFGLLTIDYKRNQYSGTLYELYDEADELVTADYLLKYLYSST
jgi:hypothetical protein